MIPGSASPFFLGSSLAAATAGGLQIERSLRFNSSDSAYCGRSFSTNGTDRKRLSLSFWIKLCDTSAARTVISGYNGSSAEAAYWQFNSGGAFTLSLGGASSFAITTTQVFRDPSAWYHFLISIDTTIASPSSDRIKLYVNGTQVTAFSSSTYPTQNYEVNLLNAGTQTNIGVAWNTGYGGYMNGYLTNIHLIDGQALTPSSFTETDATTGQLIPKTYTGSYGTNGFNLLFADNSAATASTLGKDTSGNSNNWTPNNLSVTAGAGNDSLVDSPTNYGTDTGVGGEVRGNYATWNPLSQVSASLVNGNLDATVTGAVSAKALGTIFFQTGKWYWEVTYVSTTYSSAAAYQAGVATDKLSTSDPYSSPYGWTYTDGLKYHNGSGTAMTGATITNGDVVMFAVDADAGKIWFGKNGTWFESGSPATGTNPQFTTTANQNFTFVCGSGANSCTYYLNTGQRAFAYTNSRTGFKAICTQNLPAPLVAKSNTVMDVVTYTGTGAALTPTSSLGFNPDWIWIKSRSAATDHALYDVVRGAQARLESNTTDAEVTTDGGVTAFNSAGFTLGTLAQVNTSAATYVAWCWDAGTSTVSNTAGSITSQVRANVTAGFSVVTWTGQTAAGTIGHGLGVAPSLIICKARSNAQSWGVYHKDVGINSYLLLDSTGASTSYSGIWGSSAPTSTVFGVPGNVGLNNYNTWTYVAYCFAPVVGYSNGFSYTGNGSADGSFVYLGFRPRLIMLKRSDSTSNWTLLDTSREGYNVDNDPLYPNTSAAEGTADLVDITSNGFKLRTTDASVNASAGTYIGFAWAEMPFNYSRAR